MDNVACTLWHLWKGMVCPSATLARESYFVARCILTGCRCTSVKTLKVMVEYREWRTPYGSIWQTCYYGSSLPSQWLYTGGHISSRDLCGLAELLSRNRADGHDEELYDQSFKGKMGTLTLIVFSRARKRPVVEVCTVDSLAMMKATRGRDLRRARCSGLGVVILKPNHGFERKRWIRSPESRREHGI